MGEEQRIKNTTEDNVASEEVTYRENEELGRKNTTEDKETGEEVTYRENEEKGDVCKDEIIEILDDLIERAVEGG